MAITVKHTKVSTIPDGDDSSLIRPSDWNDTHSLTGIGTMAEQNANSVAITGGTISGASISGYIPTTQKGVANGVATLDSGGTVPLSQLPPLGDLNYQGAWNANTNTPTLTSSVGTKGFYYVVSVAGTTNLNGITDWQVGDWAVFNGSVWQKIDNTDAVTSVNGYTGTVVLTQTDISGTVPTSRTITAGTGLSGGGDLSANRTLAIANSGATAGTYGSDSRSITQTVNAQGQVTSIFDQPIAIANTQVSGLGTMSTQNANAVAITGGAIDGTTIGATTPAVITGSTINANTKVVSPDYYAQSILGGNLRTSGGTSLLNWDGGGSGNVTVNGGLVVNPANKNINMSPTGTGSVTIAPATTGAMDNMVIGATTPKAITGTTVTATTFSGSGASLTSIPNSALVNSSITINGNSTALGGSVSVGTVTSVAATAGTGISVTGSPITGSGTLNITNTAPDQTVVLTAGTGISTSGTYPNFTITNTSPSSGGTVTSITAGTGLSGGTITSSGTIAIDSTVATLTGAQTLTNKTISGASNTLSNIGNSSLTNSAITINGTSTSLGGSISVGTVTSVTGTAPVVSSGGATPAISMAKATGSVDGYLSSTDWTTFNNKAAPFTYTTNYVPYGQGTTTPNQSANYTFDGTTQTAPIQRASNGIVVNSKTVSASYTIATGDNAMSAGPVTVASGQSVTVSSGSRWVVL